jgi:hypothetical protein|tara:strand:+ start:60 stop:236 length:177 start_codon:yes stop_codon:yes gene_type:complete
MGFKVGDLVETYSALGTGLILDIFTSEDYEDYFEVQFAEERNWYKHHEIVLISSQETK